MTRKRLLNILGYSILFHSVKRIIYKRQGSALFRRLLAIVGRWLTGNCAKKHLFRASFVMFNTLNCPDCRIWILTWCYCMLFIGFLCGVYSINQTDAGKTGILSSNYYRGAVKNYIQVVFAIAFWFNPTLFRATNKKLPFSVFLTFWRLYKIFI